MLFDFASNEARSKLSSTLIFRARFKILHIIRSLLISLNGPKSFRVGITITLSSRSAYKLKVRLENYCKSYRVLKLVLFEGDDVRSEVA